MERKSYSIDINRIAQYAMYAYCIFALFSLAFSVCRQAGLSLNKSHPDSNKSHPGYHQATGLAARPYSFMGNIPLHATGRRKIATTLQRVDGTLLCALIHPGPMLQSSSRNDDAERTDNTHGNYSYLDTKLYGIDFRHRLPDSRLPSVQQAQR